jgi:hypothetical protein
MEDAGEIFKMLQEVWAASGGNWKLLLPFIPLATIQVYKLPFVQEFIGKRWPNLQWGLLPKLLMGVAPVTALAMALGAGAAAVFGYNPLQKGSTLLLSKPLSYVPSPLTRATSLVVPVDLKRVEELRAERESK